MNYIRQYEKINYQIKKNYRTNSIYISYRLFERNSKVLKLIGFISKERRLSKDLIKRVGRLTKDSLK